MPNRVKPASPQSSTFSLHDDGQSLHSIHSDSTERKFLHRIRDVRIEQGISLRSISRRLDLAISELKRQEEPTTDLAVSQLLSWQKVLDVPLSDLLIESNDALSAPLHQRGQLIRIMKTAGSIDSVNKNSRVSYLCKMLREQLVALMPELQEITSWPSQGSRRSADEIGHRLENPISIEPNR